MTSISTRLRSGPLASRKYRGVLFAEIVTTAGTELALVAIAIATLQTGGGAVEIGLLLMARTLPPVLVLLLGGVFVDRIPRGRIVVSASVLALGVQLWLGLEFMSADPNFLALLLLQGALGAITAILRPAVVGLLPQVLDAEQLQPGNALLFMAGNLAGIIGPALAGVLMLVTEPSVLILIDAGTFALAALFAIRLWTVPRPEREIEEKPSFIAEWIAGWKYTVTHSWLLVTLLQALVFQATFAVFFVLGPVASAATDPAGTSWGFTAASYGVGALVGGALALRYRPRFPIVAMQLILILSVPMLFYMATNLPFAFVIPVVFVAGLAVTLADTVWEAYFQSVVPQSMLGRVSANVGVTAAALRPFSYAAAGQLSVMVGTQAVFGGAGLLLLVSIIATLIVVYPIRLSMTNPARRDASENG